MRRTSLLAVPVAFLLALIPSTASAYPNPGTVTGATAIHDPTMIRTSAGHYLLSSHRRRSRATGPPPTGPRSRRAADAFTTAGLVVA